MVFLFEISFHLQDFVLVRGCEGLHNYVLSAGGMPGTQRGEDKSGRLSGALSDGTECLGSFLSARLRYLQMQTLPRRVIQMRCNIFWGCLSLSISPLS